MIAACPKCEARYRVDESRMGAEGARLRCAKCQAVFRVRAPAAQPVEPVPAPAPAQVAAVPPPAPEIPQPPPPAPEVAMPQAPARAATAQPAAAPVAAPADPPVIDPDRLVVVADSEVDCGKGVVSALTAWGLQPILVHDGVEAMLTIQRMLPRIVILDAALPKMYGFQVCEVIKRNDSLRHTRVILVGAIHNQERYHRPPSDLYGADCYLERPDLPEGLESVIEGFGIELRRGSAPAPAPASTPVPAPQPEPVIAPESAAPPPRQEPSAAGVAGNQGPSAAGVQESPTGEFSALEPLAAESAAPAAEVVDELADARSEAERLARIIVSDVILYQPDKFEEGLRNGNVVETMEAGIEEGRTLFRQRIDSRVREEKDFIIEELLRIARERGMQ